MSIAVIGRVWASVPTSGNERLVLLASADACSRDDGTGPPPPARRRPQARSQGHRGAR